MMRRDLLSLRIGAFDLLLLLLLGAATAVGPATAASHGLVALILRVGPRGVVGMQIVRHVCRRMALPLGLISIKMNNNDNCSFAWTLSAAAAIHTRCAAKSMLLRVAVAGERSRR